MARATLGEPIVLCRKDNGVPDVLAAGSGESTKALEADRA